MPTAKKFTSDEDALLRIENFDAKMAKRGITFALNNVATDDLGQESDLLGPQTELSHRRMMTEIDESGKIK